MWGYRLLVGAKVVELSGSQYLYYCLAFDAGDDDTLDKCALGQKEDNNDGKHHAIAQTESLMFGGIHMRQYITDRNRRAIMSRS